MQLPKMIRAIAALALVFGASGAFATSYTVMLNPYSGAGDNIIHAINGGGVDASITHASGYYDDMTGHFDIYLGGYEDGGSYYSGSFKSTTPFLFDSYGNLIGTPQATLTLYLDPDRTFISNFKPGNGSTNTLTYAYDLAYMLLWGKGPEYEGGNNYSSWGKTGIDLNLKLTPVPLPGALLFFGTALAGLVGLRRRAAAA